MLDHLIKQLGLGTGEEAIRVRTSRSLHFLPRVHAAHFRCLIGGLLIFAFPVWGASVKTMPVATLTSEADHVVVGRCVSEASRWHGDKIVTDITLEISQTLKGNASPELVITALGGTAMHPRLKTPVTMNVPGGVSFDVGEEVLVFSKTSASGLNQLVGLTQGKFLIDTDALTGEKVIPVGQKVLTDEASPTDELDALISPSAELSEAETKVRLRQMRLDELIMQIRSALSLTGSNE